MLFTSLKLLLYLSYLIQKCACVCVRVRACVRARVCVAHTHTHTHTSPHTDIATHTLTGTHLTLKHAHWYTYACYMHTAKKPINKGMHVAFILIKHSVVHVLL